MIDATVDGGRLGGLEGVLRRGAQAGLIGLHGQEIIGAGVLDRLPNLAAGGDAVDRDERAFEALAFGEPFEKGENGGECDCASPAKFEFFSFLPRPTAKLANRAVANERLFGVLLLGSDGCSLQRTLRARSKSQGRVQSSLSTTPEAGQAAQERSSDGQ